MRGTTTENPKSKIRGQVLAWSISSALMLSFQAHPTFGNTGQWNTNAGGSWTDPANWLNGVVPAAPGDTAAFGPILTNPLGATVSLDGNQTVAGITFNSTAGSYTLARGTGGTLTLQGSTTSVSNLAINIAAGLDTLNVPIIANADLTVNATNNKSSGGLVIDQSIQTSGNFFFNSTGTSVADLHLNGTTSSVTAQTIVVGNTSGVSRLTIDGGTLTSTTTMEGVYSLLVGSADGSTGYLTLNTGVISVGGELWLGDRATASSFSAFTQSGGTVTIGDFFVVGNANDRAVFNMTGGVLTMRSAPITIGAGYPLGNAVGVVNVSGGTLTSASNNAVGGIFVGEIGTGVLNITNTAVVNVGHLQFGGNFIRNTVGIVNLNGGTLTVNSIYESSGIGILNFHGGILRVAASGTLFPSNAISAYVYSEGAVIDDSGNSVTFNQTLVAPTGNGVSSELPPFLDNAQNAS